MRVLRAAANTVLTVAAVLGVLSFGLWFATQRGWVQPLVVISGSMVPVYEVGDLLIDVPTDPATVKSGDVLSLRDPNGVIVTHRVVTITPAGEGWEIVMKGDANDGEDLSPYLVAGDVLRPVLRVPGAGGVIDTLRTPGAAIPLGIGLLACVGISLLRTDDEQDDDDERDDDEQDDDAAPVGPDPEPEPQPEPQPAPEPENEVTR